MRQKLLLSAVGTGLIGILAGCAQNASGGSAPSPSSSQSTSGNAPRWTANIQSVTQNRGAVEQTTRDKSYGSATWGPGESGSLSKVEVVYTYTGSEKFLSWAILPGSCGTGSLPVLPMANFPEINVGGGGRGQVTAQIPLDLPMSGSYHIDIYRDRRASMDNLVACGNMKFAG